jgi:hypothetical protein
MRLEGGEIEVRQSAQQRKHNSQRTNLRERSSTDEEQACCGPERA